MTENERPLIDVAREKFARGVRISVTDNIVAAGAYVAGYEDGRESVAAEKNAGFVDTLTLANERIAELEDQLAESKERIIAVMHAAKWDQARPAVIGVEVTEEMVERFCRQFFMNEGTWSGVFWTPSDKTRNDARNALTAALRTARTVPLASVEPWHHAVSGDPMYRGIAEVSRGE